MLALYDAARNFCDPPEDMRVKIAHEGSDGTITFRASNNGTPRGSASVPSGNLSAFRFLWETGELPRAINVLGPPQDSVRGVISKPESRKKQS